MKSLVGLRPLPHKHFRKPSYCAFKTSLIWRNRLLKPSWLLKLDKMSEINSNLGVSGSSAKSSRLCFREVISKRFKLESRI